MNASVRVRPRGARKCSSTLAPELEAGSNEWPSTSTGRFILVPLTMRGRCLVLAGYTPRKATSAGHGPAGSVRRRGRPSGSVPWVRGSSGSQAAAATVGSLMLVLPTSSHGASDVWTVNTSRIFRQRTRRTCYPRSYRWCSHVSGFSACR